MIDSSFLQLISDAQMNAIARKVIAGERITTDDALLLYQKANLSLLSLLANHVRERINGKKVSYVRNIHIEPTNICIHKCKFCSYSARVSGHAWKYTKDEILQKVKEIESNVCELHIVGGVFATHGATYYASLLSEIKTLRPDIHIKAFTAVEIQGMAEIDKISIEETLTKLKNAGLQSMPGGGAEIFDETLRKEICPTKSTAKEWLSIHKQAHELGIPTNATMLYGFFETYEHRVDHLDRLRLLQDQTHGFNAFIPLKFKNKNNEYSHISEVSITEDMRNYAVSRIFLDNIPHLKSYWPMMGIDLARLSLHFGIDDLDGTINNSTQIYTMAGSKEASMSAEGLNQVILSEGFVPQERDALYNAI